MSDMYYTAVQKQYYEMPWALNHHQYCLLMEKENGVKKLLAGVGFEPTQSK